MRSLLLLCFLFASAPGYAQWSRAYPPKFDDAREETYKTVGDVELKLWVWEPEGNDAQERPAVVFFFGGGWNGGVPAQFEQHCRYLAKRGFVAMSADYRVRGRNKTLADRCVADAKSAVRWIRTNAKRLRVDPDKIVAGGGSAGGHIAACTGVVKGLDEEGEDLSISSVPNAMALFNPAMLLCEYDGINLDEEKAAEMATRTGVTPKEISPIHHVRSGQPPMIIFHGKDDPTVPYVTVDKYARVSKAAGNTVVLKGYDGAKHGFFNYGRGGTPGEYFSATVYELDKFLVSLGYIKGEPLIAIPESANVHLRSGFHHSRRVFQQTKKGNVAFLGGSITQMNGYRTMVEEYLQQKFPSTEFTFSNAGLSSTCSTTGAFRLKTDVLSTEPDLLFVEFAVNDDQDAAHAERECRRGMEGILRQALSANPNLDIVVTHFVNPPMLEKLQAGETPISSGTHESVAAHYGVSTSDLAREVAQRITAESLTWKVYGGTHPKPAGNRIAADMIADLLDTAWKSPKDAKANPKARRLAKQLDENSYTQGSFVDPKTVSVGDGWKHFIPDWSLIKGSLRPDYADRKLFCSTQSGAELNVAFTGTAVGLFVLAGPDAGSVEFSVDGNEYQTADLYHRFSKGLHYPRTVMLATDLDSGEHQLKLRVAKDANPSSKGTAVRILEVVKN